MHEAPPLHSNVKQGQRKVGFFIPCRQWQRLRLRRHLRLLTKSEKLAHSGERVLRLTLSAESLVPFPGTICDGEAYSSSSESACTTRQKLKGKI
jgi:hypothetical protein